MKNDVIKISPELWQPLEKEAKDAEKIDRPSLTFLQDGWRRLRSNTVAMLSLLIILLITIGAIITPFYWQYSYKEQNLDLANIPAIMKVYQLGDSKNFIYITPQYGLIVVDERGHLLGPATTERKDIVSKKNYYSFDKFKICVDYSVYSNAANEYKEILKKSKISNSDKVTVSSVKYLAEYYDSVSNAPDEIKISQAYNILEHHINRVRLTVNDTLITNHVNMRNKTYLLGTDGLGRDLFIRIVYGARISLLVGFIAALINFVVGVFYGAISGYIGGEVDNIMMRIIDTIDSIPMTLYVILIMVVVGPGLISIILALGLTFWVKMARIVRGQVLTLKQQEFVKAAVVVGADTKRIISKHLIPNMMGPIMVNIAMQIPSAIFNEAFLSFVGLGISAPMASWGTLCNDALAGIYIYPYQMIFPAIAISLTILTFNLFSDGLRDAFDPKQRK